MTTASDLRVKIFADGADLDGIRCLAADPMIRGVTTNPTLMRAAGVADYEAFAHDVLAAVGGKPVSFEVLSDDFGEMEKQALRIGAWADNVFVKIPVTNTKGERTTAVLRNLASSGVRVNVTAVFTPQQVAWILDAIADGPPSCVSLFAGRIADAGVDPIPVMREILTQLESVPGTELIWASPREVLNIVQADEIGCHIITVTHDLLKKLVSLGKDLEQFSLETVQMFRRDAEAAGYTL